MFGHNKEKKLEKALEKKDVMKICEYLQDADKAIVIKAMDALSTLKGDESALNALIPWLHNRDKELQIHAALALGKLGNNACMTHLSYQLKNEKDESVKKALTEAIEMLKGV